MKLYRAWSTIEEFKGFKDVPIFWYCPKREKPVLTYEVLIDNYNAEDEDSCYSESHANEFFTESEISELRRVLSKFPELKDASFYVEEVTYPFSKECLPLGAVPSDSKHGSFQFNQVVIEDLGFQLCGYYDLRPFMEDDYDKAENETEHSNCSSHIQSDDYLDDLPF